MTFIKYLPGATPLDLNEIAGLIPSYITTQGELDTHEQSGILEAQVWATSKNHKDILTEQFAKNLHHACSSRFGAGPDNLEILINLLVFRGHKLQLN